MDPPRIRVGSRTTLVLAVLARGCGRERTENRAPSFQALKQQELRLERNEYIQERRERLSEVAWAMERIQAKLNQQSPFMDESRRATWRQQLNDLRQEKARLKTRIERARASSPEQWQAMRRNGSAGDPVLDGVRELRAEVARALALRGEPARNIGRARLLSAAPGACVVDVAGADTESEEPNDRVMVAVTTKNREVVPALQRKAGYVDKTTQIFPATATDEEHLRTDWRGAPTADASVQRLSTDEMRELVEVEVSVSNLDDGVTISLIPRSEGSQNDGLGTRLERDAASLGEGLCASTEPDVSISRE